MDKLLGINKVKETKKDVYEEGLNPGYQAGKKAAKENPYIPWVKTDTHIHIINNRFEVLLVSTSEV